MAKTENTQINTNLLLSAPHVHSGMTVSKLMQQVIWGLSPALLLGLYLFGMPALLLVVASVGAALFTEFLCQKIQKQPLGQLTDGSAMVTALLLIMSLPPHFPWYLGALGAAIAVCIGKQVYGGLGQNLFNPAMLARVVLIISFPVAMTNWVSPAPVFPLPGIFSQLSDGMTGATLLGQVVETGSTEIHLSFFELILGAAPGSLGESPLLLLIGGIWMIWKKVIDWRTSVSVILGCVVPATIAWLVAPDAVMPPGAHLFGGGLMLTAFFIATDPVTSPASAKGRIFFGLGTGALIFVIRVFGAFPEGAAFAILLMNAITPLLENVTQPRAYGEYRKSLLKRGANGAK